MNGVGVDILMYHSVSEGPGPTCINPQTFRRQMALLEECGYRGIGLATFISWMRGESADVGKSVVLTFDDAFTDFADVAFPELEARGWTATVYVPSGKVGLVADFDRRTGWPDRQIMSWEMISDLAEHGVDVGAHGITHADLTMLAPEKAREEVIESRHCIEDRISRSVTSFAAPYGRTNLAVQREIRRHYQASVSVELARIRPTSDLHNLPRIEMWYFREPERWRKYLTGGGRLHFALRQVARRARGLLR